MIKVSGTGFAVENAHPELIEACDFVCVHHDRHAASYVIDWIEKNIVNKNKTWNQSLETPSNTKNIKDGGNCMKMNIVSKYRSNVLWLLIPFFLMAVLFSSCSSSVNKGLNSSLMVP